MLQHFVQSFIFYGTIVSNVRVSDGGAALVGTLGCERKALDTGISLHGGSVEQPGVDLCTGDFERWLKRGSGCETSLSMGFL